MILTGTVEQQRQQILERARLAARQLAECLRGVDALLAHGTDRQTLALCRELVDEEATDALAVLLAELDRRSNGPEAPPEDCPAGFCGECAVCRGRTRAALSNGR